MSPSSWWQSRPRIRAAAVRHPPHRRIHVKTFRKCLGARAPWHSACDARTPPDATASCRYPAYGREGDIRHRPCQPVRRRSSRSRHRVAPCARSAPTAARRQQKPALRHFHPVDLCFQPGRVGIAFACMAVAWNSFCVLCIQRSLIGRGLDHPGRASGRKALPGQGLRRTSAEVPVMARFRLRCCANRAPESQPHMRVSFHHGSNIPGDKGATPPKKNPSDDPATRG